MAGKDTGASSHKPDWPKRKPTPEENVRRLQARIAKAQEAGRHNRVKALQRILAHSYSARVIAVERVSTNKGAKTPGVDGKTWTTPEERRLALDALKARGY